MNDRYVAGVGEARAYSFTVLPAPARRPAIEALFHNAPHNPLWIDLV